MPFKGSKSGFVEILSLWWVCLLFHKYLNIAPVTLESCFRCGQRGGALAEVSVADSGVSCVGDALWGPLTSQPRLSPHPRTALMLGCEYGCKDAVEVLLRNGADVALTDGLGHDCAYYARIGDNIDILALIKAALEDSSRGRRKLQHLPLGGIVSLLLWLQELFWRAAVLL